MIAFEKFGQHQPLNRQAERYALEDVPIALSTMADAIGSVCAALDERSAAPYAAVRQSLGEPDPFWLRYREQLREIIADLVRSRLARKDAAARIAAWSAKEIDPGDRQRFAEVAEAELTSLHEGNFARYRIRPSEFAAWRQFWEAK